MMLRLLLLLTTLPLVVQAQIVAPAPLAGVIWDSVSGRPITRGAVVLNDAVAVSLDRRGEFRFAAIPDTGALRIKVWCKTSSIFSHTLVERPLDRDQRLSRLKFPVDGEACDLRPLYEISGVFVGHWRSGFEESEFVPCGVGPAAWVDLAPGVAEGVRWPRGGDKYYPRYFVRFRGTLEGPGRYGHMGAASHHILISKILEVREPARGDCSP